MAEVQGWLLEGHWAMAGGAEAEGPCSTAISGHASIHSSSLLGM